MRPGRIPVELAERPFTSATAAKYGVTRSALRGTSWRRLHRGVWVATDVALSYAILLAAARLAMPVDAVLCGLSACTAWGIDVRRADDRLVYVGFAEQVPRKRAGLVLRELLLRPDEVVVRDGWLVTTPVRTAFDCARWLPLVEAVVVVDALCHAGLLRLSELTRFAATHPGIRWVTRIARVVDISEPLSESPMETRLRLLLVLAGLPRPRAQLVIRDITGAFLGRVDLVYEAQRLVIEYDGAEHWTQRRADDRRRDRLRTNGWTVLVYSAEDYFQNPHTITAQVAAELRKVIVR